MGWGLWVVGWEDREGGQAWVPDWGQQGYRVGVGGFLHPNRCLYHLILFTMSLCVCVWV